MADVLLATYADLKTVKTRSTCQLILELPIEKLTEVVGLLGAPVPGSEIYVAVARLNLDAPQAEQVKALKAPPRASQMAGILCNNGAFRKFLSERGNVSVPDAESAAKIVRFSCAVNSRADLDTSEAGAKAWRDLKADFDAWMVEPGVAA